MPIGNCMSYEVEGYLGKGDRVSCGATFENLISFIIFNDVVVSF